MTDRKKEVRKDADKKGDKEASRKKEFGKWLLVPVATLVISTGCGDARPVYDPVPPTSDAGQTDGSQTDGTTDGGGVADGDQVNGDQVDGGPQVDGDGGQADAEVFDAGPSDGDVTDGGPVDGEETDGGQADGEVVDGGDETPEACEGVFNDSVREGMFPTDTPVSVGGYSITYTLGDSTNYVPVDIRCEATGMDIAIDVRLRMEKENVIEASQDGKVIKITPYSRNAWRMKAHVTVEDL